MTQNEREGETVESYTSRTCHSRHTRRIALLNMPDYLLLGVHPLYELENSACTRNKFGCETRIEI